MSMRHTKRMQKTTALLHESRHVGIYKCTTHTHMPQTQEQLNSKHPILYNAPSTTSVQCPVHKHTSCHFLVIYLVLNHLRSVELLPSL